MGSMWRMKGRLGSWESPEVLRPFKVFMPCSNVACSGRCGVPTAASSLTLSSERASSLGKVPVSHLPSKQQLAARPSFTCPLGAIELQRRELYRQGGHR